MEIHELPLPGCFEITAQEFKDERGLLIKTFQEEFFRAQGLESNFVEEFYTVSHRGVLRGMHFQAPPQECVKTVFCPLGKVMDALVDLRVGSPMYGKYHLIEMSAEKANQIYMPAGIAHGYLALNEESIVIYKMTKPFSQECDTGLHWKSFGIPWPRQPEIVSRRDEAYPPFSDYQSPFFFSA